MEKIDLKLNCPQEFDAVLKDCLPECGDLTIITKHAAMESGAAAVMLTFTVRLPDGSLERAQAVTTMKLFRTITQVFQGTYNDEGFPAEGVGGATVFDDPTIESEEAET